VKPSPAATLLDELRQLGVKVESRDGRLHLRPAERVDADLRARLMESKLLLLALLTAPRLARHAWTTDPSWRPRREEGWTHLGGDLWVGPCGELTSHADETDRSCLGSP
jgi:hypothetical protein